METIQLIIDNKEVEVPRGTTILDAAKSVGIQTGGLALRE